MTGNGEISWSIFVICLVSMLTQGMGMNWCWFAYCGTQCAIITRQLLFVMLGSWRSESTKFDLLTLQSVFRHMFGKMNLKCQNCVAHHHGLWCNGGGLVDGNVLARDSFCLAPSRLGVVDVPAKLVKVEDVKVIGCPDLVNEVLSQFLVITQSLKLGRDHLV